MSLNFKRAFTENIAAKLVALFVALFIWFSASGQQQASRFFVAPVKLVNTPDSLVIVGAYPEEAEITISGTKRELLYLSFRRIEIVVNLAAATPGRFRQRLSASNVVVRGGLDPRNVQIITPSSIDLFFERLSTKSVPVDLTVIGSVPTGYVLAESPKIEPTVITIKGAATAVARQKSIPTKPLDLGRVRESFEREIEIDYDGTVFRCEPDRVTVSITVSELGERVLPNIPPTVLFDAEQYVAEVYPSAVSLTLAGLKTVLDTLSSGDVSILLDVSDKPPGRYTLVPDVIVPKGIGSYSLSEDSITVIVRKGTARGNQ
ncbi:MAG: hypothetical protein GTO51_01105 [Candidatus Latescibacteria bacterium]|nr:hypothetical protein [Candidatus Latescibacterota bacterium]NIM21597.1 hypothetical protein [Candidatus Latescibacterota bacterium]NIM64576.1 hypothetical protein [Candidatus Latescibacterota bacterium]NIO01091.1 hypothetical protein [Candidatus Latescibacterota bacterium]NIO27484.1 hypothetical protein [Candidatus Latescibacterota bacterium]